MDELIKRIQKLKPEPGESVIFWTDRIGNKEEEKIVKYMEHIKQQYPFTFFIFLPHRGVIKGLRTYDLEKLSEQLDSLKHKIDSTILSRK